MGMKLVQGAHDVLDFPVVDDNEDPMNLTTDFTDMCVVIAGAGRKLTYKPGDSGFEIVDSAATDDAMRVTVTPADKVGMRPGKLYTFEAWATGADGKKRIVSGDCTVIMTEGCD